MGAIQTLALEWAWHSDKTNKAAKKPLESECLLPTF